MKHWITLNEPWTYAVGGYALGNLAPGRCSQWFGHCTAGDSATEPYLVAYHLLLSHAAAVKVYKDKYQVHTYMIRASVNNGLYEIEDYIYAIITYKINSGLTHLNFFWYKCYSFKICKLLNKNGCIYVLSIGLSKGINWNNPGVSLDGAGELVTGECRSCPASNGLHVWMVGVISHFSKILAIYILINWKLFFLMMIINDYIFLV